jgi:hypothetical protein
MTDKFKIPKPGETMLEPKPCPEYVSMDKLAPKSTNPKDRIGMHKPPLHLIPPSFLVHVAMALKNGAQKYGPYNWRDEKVSACIYLSAAGRHLAEWLDGQENASDSSVHHLAHAAACMAILLDAQAVGQLVDDRPKPGVAAALIEQFTEKKTP